MLDQLGVLTTGQGNQAAEFSDMRNNLDHMDVRLLDVGQMRDRAEDIAYQETELRQG